MIENLQEHEVFEYEEQCLVVGNEGSERGKEGNLFPLERRRAWK